MTKKKKMSALDKAKQEVKELKERVVSFSRSYDAYKAVCDSIRGILGPKSSTYGEVYNKRNIELEDLPAEVMKLKLYVEGHQGAEHPIVAANRDLKDIIRWLVNPDCVEQKYSDDPQLNYYKDG